MRRRATPRRLARLARSGLRARGAPILQRRKCARLCARAHAPGRLGGGSVTANGRLWRPQLTFGVPTRAPTVGAAAIVATVAAISAYLHNHYAGTDSNPENSEGND